MTGLSGFPKVYESEHDIFNTGHSSTSISSAVGIAVANKLDGKDDYTIAVIGDGAMTGGLAFEGLNNANIKGTNLIVILNDNQMSISASVGNIAKDLSKVRAAGFYRSSKNGLKTFLGYIPFLGKCIIKFLDWMKRGLKYALFPKSTLFDHFGFTYLGPIDGHNLKDLTEILRIAKVAKKPVLVHVVTKKGKGYSFAEANANLYHGVSPFNKETGVNVTAKKSSYSSKFGDTITKLAESNKKIVAITAAMPDGTGLNKFKERFPDRFFDVGIAEEHAVTFAGGLAKQGYIPVFAVYSTFLQRAYDQIIHDVALQNAHVIFAIDRAGIVGQDGATHQGIYDMSFLSSIPNMTIMAPKDGRELEKMLEFAVNSKGPVAIRYPRDGYYEELCPLVDTNVTKSEIIREGKDITLIGYGKMVKRAIDVADLLKLNGVEAEVINLRFLKPLDRETIIESIKKTRNVVTIEDGIINGGVASAIQELIKNIEGVKKINFAYPDEFIKHGKTDEIEKLYGMDAENIFNIIYRNF